MGFCFSMLSVPTTLLKFGKKTNIANPVLPPVTDHGWNEDGSLT